MLFDAEAIVLAAVLVILPAVFAILSVKRHVSRFMRDVEAEEQTAENSGRDENAFREQTDASEHI